MNSDGGSYQPTDEGARPMRGYSREWAAATDEWAGTTRPGSAEAPEPQPQTVVAWKAASTADVVGDLDQGEVLWIRPDMCRIPELPDGFALRVRDFLGSGGVDARGVRLVWVRGPVLDAHGAPGRDLQLCVPLDQPRAVPVNRMQPTSARHALGTPPVTVGRAEVPPTATDVRDYVTGPDGRQYRRVQFPNR